MEGNNRDVRGRLRRLTVAHIMPWSGMGGVEVATLRMVEATREQFRNVAFCLSDANALRDSFTKMGIETVVYAPPEPSLRHGARFYSESRAVARLLRAADVDIVHFADLKAAYHNSLAAFLAGSRTVCHLRGSNSHLTMRDKLCLLPVQRYIFVSQEARKSFALPLPDRKARVIYDAVDIPAVDRESNSAVREELGVPQGCVLVGMVARVAPVKDYFTLASAAAEVLGSHPDTHFLVVGDNSEVELNRTHYKEVTGRLKELGIADRFIFTGHRSDVSRLISAMDICVLCTHREGFPLSILEFMALRKPVVATAVGGIPEIVEDGVTGYLHEHEDSKGLAAAIVSYMDDPDVAARIGTTAYERVRQSYSREMFTNEIAEAYRDVMRR